MIVTIEKIKLQNFKGIANLEVIFGKETGIFGQNATGKTTIFDGFLWALFGKDSLNQATFDIKGLDAQGNPAHNLEHSVEVSMSVDEQPFVVLKTLAEKWTKKRGTAAKEFTGHTTEYAINGVPLKEGEFKNRIKGFIDEGVFRLLTDPREFNEALGWKSRREILLAVCGDVSAAEIISGNPDLNGLTNLLSGKTVEDVKKVIAAKKKDINESLEKIPTRIDEAKRSLAEVRPDIDLVPGMVAGKEEIKAGLEAKLIDTRNGGALSTKRVELQNVQAEIQEARGNFNRDMALLLGPLNKELDAVQDKARKLKRVEADLKATLNETTSDIEAYERELVRLREEWNRIEDQAWTGATICPSCGRDLPANQIQEAQAKHNLSKAEKLAGNEARGKERAAKIAEYKARIDAANKDLDAVVVELAETTAREHELQAKIAEVRAQQPDFSALEQKKAGIQSEIDSIAAGAQAETGNIEAEIATVKAEIRALNGDLLSLDANRKTEKRILDLEDEEKRLATEYEKVEADLQLIEKYTRAMVDAMDAKISAKFRMARFRLFEPQINGGLNDQLCETTLNGVPYSSMNNAGRVQVGLDIIRTLQAHYGIIAPVWIDNRESIVELPEMAGQVISLIVSEADKTLRIETSESKKAA